MSWVVKCFKPFLVPALCIALLCVLLPNALFRDVEFDRFIHRYHKKYHNQEEYLLKLEVYQNNQQLIDHFNRTHSSVKLKMNQFGDYTHEEFKRDLFIPLADELTKEMCLSGIPPDKVDWTEMGVVPRVVDHSNDGYGVPFVVVYSIEAAHYIRTHNQSEFSIQQLIDCVGTSGALSDFYDYIVKFGGLMLEKDYPYTGVANVCKADASKVAVKLKGYQDVDSGNQEQLKLAVAQQPVAVAVAADELVFQFYSEGVISGNCGTNVDHGVLVVGYGETQEGEKYWKIQNFWGKSWGQEGYALLKRTDTSNTESTCGIADVGSYPIL